MEETGFFSDHTNIKIFHRSVFEPSDRAALIVCHGLGEHSGRYGNLLAELRRQNIAFFAIDHAGHGQSGGGRGCLPGFDYFVLSVRRLADHVRAKMGPEKKIFILGHSMGGLIAAQTILRFPELFAGAIISSPALELAVKVPAVKGAAGKAMAGILPWLTLDNELNPEHISRDPEVVKAYVADPLVHRRISTRLFADMMTNMDGAQARAERVTIPLLGIHGTGDRITSPEGTKRFVARASSSDKGVKLYEGAYHETMNDFGWETVVKDVVSWIVERS